MGAHQIQNPAQPGEVLVFFATGLGALTPALETGEPSAGNQTITPATATIDGLSAIVQFAGAAPGFVALNQINIVVPLNVGTGNDIPVVLNIGGQPANTVTIPVAP